MNWYDIFLFFSKVLPSHVEIMRQQKFNYVQLLLALRDRLCRLDKQLSCCCEKTFPSSKIADLKVFLRLYVWIMLSNFLEMICPAKTTKTMESFKVSTTQFFGLQCHDFVNSSPTFFRSNFLGQTPKETYL